MYALSALSVSSDNSYIVRYYNGWIEDQNLYIVVSLISIFLMKLDGTL